MKKSDLKTGMLVVTRSGDKGIVLRGMGEKKDAIVADGKGEGRTWFPLHALNEDLTYPDSSKSDIVEVWSFGCNYEGARLLEDGRELLFKRPSNTVIVPLNSSYKAIVFLDRKEVEVGCQTFSFEKIKELYEATCQSC